jgi:CheY-like chemotaxis protein
VRVRFWGTRGSIAKPGPATLRYGGNTSCVEVRSEDGTLVVLDCGTGAHELARALRSEAPAPVSGHLLIGHTHWDHIQGFPFFEPLFSSQNTWNVYVPGGHVGAIESSLSQQMSYDYHPITLTDLHASVRYHPLTEGAFDLGGIRIIAQYLHHPALTLGYRLEADGAAVVYAADHEPHSLHPLDAPPGAGPIHLEDRRHLRLLADADLVIHDAQYVLDEFPEKAGWGHTPVERAVDYALAAGARRLALFHHDPERSDEAVDRLCRLGAARAAAAGSGLEVFAAAEGNALELRGAVSRPRPPIPATCSALLSGVRRAPTKLLVVSDDPVTARQLRGALAQEGLALVEAEDGEAALRAARREHPSLILLDLNGHQVDGLAVCRRLRAEEDPYLREVPVLVLSGSALSEQGVLAAFESGATDHIAKPVKPTLVRSRVSGWLMRARAG